MTADELRAFFQRNAGYLFPPLKCRAAGINLIEARFLRDLAIAERDNRWVFANSGAGRAYQVLQRGWVTNPLGTLDNARTNVWQLTERGIAILNSLIDDAGTNIQKINLKLESNHACKNYRCCQSKRRSR